MTSFVKAEVLLLKFELSKYCWGQDRVLSVSDNRVLVFDSLINFFHVENDSSKISSKHQCNI